MRQFQKKKEFAGRTDEEQLEYVLNLEISRNIQNSASIFNSSNIDIIFYQNKRQKQNLRLFPEMLFIDTTHAKNIYRYPVVVFMVVDGDNKGRSAGYAVVRSETSLNFSLLYRQLLTENESLGSSIKTVVIDKCPAELNAVEKEFSVDIVICRFHVVQAMFRNIHIQDKSDCTDIKIHILSLITCSLETEFSTTYDKLPHHFKQYLNKHWLKIKKSWAACFMGHVVTYGNKTNNVLERHNRILKTLDTRTDKIPCMFKEFISNLELLEHEQDQEILLQSLSIKNYHTRFHQIVDEIKVFVTDLGCKLFIEETKLAEDFLNNNGSFSVEHDGVTMQGDGDSVKFNIQDYKCCCQQYKNTGFPCLHMILYFNKYPKEKILIDSIPKKYHKTQITSFYSTKDELKQILHFQDDVEGCAQENLDGKFQSVIYQLGLLYDKNKCRSSNRVEELSLIVQRWEAENNQQSATLSLSPPEQQDNRISFISMPGVDNTLDNAPKFDAKSKTRHRLKKTKSKGFQNFKNKYRHFSCFLFKKGIAISQNSGKRKMLSIQHTDPNKKKYSEHANKKHKNDGCNEKIQKPEIVELAVSKCTREENYKAFLNFNTAYTLKFNKEMLSEEDLNSQRIPNLKINLLNIEDEDPM